MNNYRSLFSSIPTIFCISWPLFLAGCTTFYDYPSQASVFYHDYRSNHLDKATEKVARVAQRRSRSIDRLLWSLEKGTVLRANRKFEQSNEAFDQAEAIVEEFDSRALVSLRDVGSSFGASITNLNAIPYQGYAYDRIMLNTYKALNFIALERFDKAVVEITRAYERQKEALNMFQRQLDKLEDDATRHDVDVNAVENNSRFKEQLDSLYGGRPSLGVVSDFVNPLTTYIDGLLLAVTGQGGADLERARLNFERVKAMLDDSAYLDDDLQMVDNMIYARPIQPAVYLILEIGMSPVRRDARIDLPIFTDEIDYVGASFPRLEYQDLPLNFLRIIAGDEVIGETAVLSNMDNIIANEMNNLMKVVVNRTLISSTFKAAAQYSLYKEFGELGRYTATLLSVALNRADLRSWLTLPKQFQFARLPRPPSMQIVLESPDGKFRTRVDLPDSEITLLYAKVVDDSTIAIINTVKLR